MEFRRYSLLLFSKAFLWCTFFFSCPPGGFEANFGRKSAVRFHCVLVVFFSNLPFKLYHALHSHWFQCSTFVLCVITRGREKAIVVIEIERRTWGILFILKSYRERDQVNMCVTAVERMCPVNFIRQQKDSLLYSTCFSCYVFQSFLCCPIIHSLALLTMNFGNFSGIQFLNPERFPIGFNWSRK